MMNKLILLFFLLVSSHYFSQTLTKKYNDYSNRYEYYNSTGIMLGYEKYNIYSKQWEYYEINSQQARQPTQYRDPEKLDIGVLGNAMSGLQNNYNYNVRQVQITVNNIYGEIDDLDISNSDKSLIKKTFGDQINKNINNQKINYGSSNKTNEIINWLYDTVNKIVKNVTTIEQNTSANTSSNYSSNNYSETKKTNYSNSSANNSKIKSFEEYYNNSLGVYRIAIYNENTLKFQPDEKITNNSYIILRESYIEFKRADGSISQRPINNKKFNSKKKGYDYTSIYGAVFIKENLSYVQFYSEPTPKGESYTYFINNN